MLQPKRSPALSFKATSNVADLDNSPAPGNAATLLEREDVLASLNDCLADLCEGEGRIVSISGEAGIGKSSVIRAFTKQNFDSFLLAKGGCEDLRSSRPLGPLFDMALALGEDFATSLEEGPGAASVAGRLLMLLQRSAKPAVLIFEDIHWADDATLDLIKVLARRAGQLPLLLVLTHREDHAGDRRISARVLGNVSTQDLLRLPLDPLSPDAVAKLTAGGVADAQRIYEITNGNPFFVSEILACDAKPDHDIPISVRDAVWARIEHCSIEQRIAIEAVSILPNGGARELIASLITNPQAEQIDDLLAAGLLVEEEGVIRFRHELARQSVAYFLPEGRRKRLHRAASHWLEQHCTAKGTATLTERLHHAEAAGDDETVARLAPDAAARAARMGAHKQAAHLLGIALTRADRLGAEATAQLQESWSYEAGLSEHIDDEVIAAREKAIVLWEGLGKIEKIGLNYRWLSRLHWYRGEADKAEYYLALAIEKLESIEPGPELAWSYSTRSQWAMLNDRFDEALDWGERALALADRFDEVEIRVHALNSMGTSLMLSNDVAHGQAMMEESLELALRHDFHEQAARAYTNMAEYALTVRDLPLAEHYLDAGIDFDSQHDLDSWLHYLRGCQARFLMMRGQLEEAEQLAEDILATPNQTFVMRLPALTTRAQVQVRLGKPGARERLEALLNPVLETREPQRILPVRIALAEAAWLAGDRQAALKQIELALPLVEVVTSWDHADLLGWSHRAGNATMPLPAGMPPAIHLECNGKPAAAARAYAELAMPFERGLALCSVQGPERTAALQEAASLFASIGAGAAQQRVSYIALREGIALEEPSTTRRQYGASRTHPAGLTKKEQIVLTYLCEGNSNQIIANRMCRSVRTVEHHVSTILSKLGVSSRQEAIARNLDQQSRADL